MDVTEKPGAGPAFSVAKADKKQEFTACRGNEIYS